MAKGTGNSKRGRIRFSETSSVRRTYVKGKLIETVNSTNIRFPNPDRVKKQKTLDMIAAEVERFKIEPHFGNYVAKLVKNPKRDIKNKLYIPLGNAEQFFKSSYKTSLNEIRLLYVITKSPDKHGIDAERLEDLKQCLNERVATYWMDYPREVLKYEPLRKYIALRPEWLKQWYAKIKDVPEWMLDETPIEEIKKFYEDKCAEADA